MKIRRRTESEDECPKKLEAKLHVATSIRTRVDTTKRLLKIAISCPISESKVGLMGPDDRIVKHLGDTAVRSVDGRKCGC